MPRNRFQAIIACIYFSDNSEYDLNDPNRDSRLYVIW